MNIDLFLPNDVVRIVLSLLSWIVIGFLAAKKIRQNEQKPIWWKAVIVTLIGLFTLNIKAILWGEPINIPLLPLGVWFSSCRYSGKTDKWAMYRGFAWLGFTANYLLLAAMMIAIPLHNYVFPKDDPATYLADVQAAVITATHPSGEDASINIDALREAVKSLKKEDIQVFAWYRQIQDGTEPNDRRERFPYQLTGIRPKWGSGIPTLIYLEQNGMGILITTPKKQLYFLSDQSLLEGGR